MGLCQSWYKHGLKESEECQELVTACVMARVSAVGKSIPLSLRSESPIVSPLRDQVLTDTRFRESPRGEDPSEGWPIPSFSMKCRDRECNWSPAHVGTCVPGQEIQLAVDDPSDPSACDSTALRACAGIHGCMGPDLHMLPDGSPLPPYSKHLGEKLGACRRSPLEFACPSNKATAGYYSVMTRPAPASIARKPARTHTVVKIQGSGTYPAPEKDVFTFPEGAFYGNMFKPETLTLSCTLNGDAGPTMVCTTADQNVCDIDLKSGESTERCAEYLISLPYRDVHACYAYTQQMEDDAVGVAALNQRLCNSLDANAKCFAYRPQRCRYKNPGINEVKGAHCEVMGKDGAYGSCANQIDDTTRFERIITTYLNAPCDFLGEGSLCDAMRGSMAPPASRPGRATEARTGSRGTRVQGGDAGGAGP